jgi:hypothetical protein
VASITSRINLGVFATRIRVAFSIEISSCR